MTTTATEITWTTTTWARATYRHTMDTTTLTLTAQICDNPTALPDDYPTNMTAFYEVSGVGWYNTAQGRRLQGTHSKTFIDLDEARAYANRWATTLTSKGYERTA